MTVLLVRPAASGGLSAHVDHELALLRAAGRDVAEAPVRIGERPHPLGDLRTVRTLRGVLRASASPTTLHAHGLRAGALSALALPGRGPHRLVVTLHNRTVGSRATRTIGAGLLRILARRADVVLAVSPDLAAQARRAGARDVRHAVVPVPEAPGTVGPTAGAGPGDAGGPGDATGPGGSTGGTAAPPEEPVDGPGPAERLEILVIARLAPQKGLHDLLDAAALLRDGAPVRIRIAGDGPLHEELAARIRAERLPVELLGRRADVPALLAAADLVVSAARWEGQPVSLQEALLAGAAIIATDAGGTRWVTGEAAHLVPVGDARALAAAITALRDPGARRTARAASRRRARELPTAEDLLAQLDAVLAPGPRPW
jgi:glycosyltransferase involved in cell wall biosynthesis